ncbi:MAG TPA: FliM/FliN family flagellar motor switch protein [Bryobacteraceae bacterium]|jgi:flagellar motor switch protein FliN/FliY|nr:FliM/FliN family flagellar motor switch protein [Bryobacteraceae bacterium]
MTALEEIAHLADIRMDVDVELDRTSMTVRSILALEAGSVIAMQRSAGENIDILIGGALIGSGEIVIIEDTVGVRITDFREDV